MSSRFHPTDSDFKELNFTCDQLQLKGYYHPAIESGTGKVIIGLHGLLANADSPKQLQMAAACVRISLGYLRLNHRGCGRSQGDFAQVTSFAGRCRDVTAAAEHLRQMGLEVVGLFGSSLGGAVALQMAQQLAVGALVTVAAPVCSAQVQLRNEPGHDLPAGLSADRLFFDVSASLAGLPPLLLFHGENDTVVPYANARAIFEGASSPKRLITLDGGDHRVSRPHHQHQLIHESAAWFSRYAMAQ